MSTVDKRKKQRKAAKEQRAGEQDKAKEVASIERKQELEEAHVWLRSLNVDSVINPRWFQEAQLTSVKQEFRQNQPFPHYFMPNFMDDAFLTQMKEELMDEEFYQKTNDLFDFVQTKDLKTCKKPLIGKMREVLYSEKFRHMLTHVTGIQLNPLSDMVDMSGAIYQHTHHLLCHDDELDQRRIAYILYLVPADWQAADGGCLDLFNVDDQGQPAEVAKSVVPQWNSFVFFEVSPVSYHQVSEVLAKKTRLSISGWFYGDNIARPPHPVEPILVKREPEPHHISLEDWINRTYRRKNAVAQAAAKFHKESSIELPGILRRDKYDALVAQMHAERAGWRKKGPPQKRHYSVYDPTQATQLTSASFAEDAKSAEVSASPSPAADLPSGGRINLVTELRKFMYSKVFASFLQELTGLQISSGAVEVRLFAAGDYTLCHDADQEAKEAALDVILCCLPQKKWKPEWGGTVHYVDEGETEELLEIPAAENTLSLVYRAEPGTFKFVKYVNQKATTNRYDVCAVYRCVEDEDPDDDDDDDNDKVEEEAKKQTRKLKVKPEEEDEEEEKDEEEEEVAEMEGKDILDNNSKKQATAVQSASKQKITTQTAVKQQQQQPKKKKM